MTKEDKDAGILYDPETNIRYGAYMMSYLYTEYSRWNTVFAIMDAGQDTVDQWMLNRKLVDELGNLIVFPEEKTDIYVNQVNETMEVYRSLYYTNP